MDRTVVFDVDGVILDYMGSFTRYMSDIHKIEPKIPFEEEKSWTLENMYPAEILRGRHVGNYITQMSEDPSYFANIPFLNGAKESIKELHDDGFRVDILTSCGNREDMKAMRLKNLDPILPYITEINILPLGGDKTEHLSKYPEGTLFFDDYHKNVSDAVSVGLDGRQVLIPALKGQKNTGTLKTVDDWKDIKAVIRKKFEPALDPFEVSMAC